VSRWARRCTSAVLTAPSAAGYHRRSTTRRAGDPVDTAAVVRNSAGVANGRPVETSAAAGGRGAVPRAPGPGGRPLEDQLRPFEADPLGFLEQVRAAHGDVVRLQLWPEVCHLVSDPDEVQRLLVTEADRYHAQAGPERDDVTAALRFHQLVREALHGDDGVTSLVPVMVDALVGWLDAVDERVEATPGPPLDMAHESAVAMLDLLGRALLDEDLRSVHGRGDGAGQVADLDELARAFVTSAAVGAPHRAVSAYQLLERRSMPADPVVEEAAATIAATVRGLIAARRARGPGDDLLSRIVFDDDTGAADRLRSDDQVEAAVAVLLVAGHSAPASALAWTMHLVGRHPEVRDRLEREVDEVLGDRPPGAGDLAGLRTVRAVLMEAMRLYPPVWLLVPRLASEPDEIGGHLVPAGTKVLVSPWVLHRHPAVWDRPEDFDPDRFARREPRAYLPFGAGPWGCVGARLGMVQTRLALALLVQRFRWSAAGDGDVTPDPHLALWPRGGLPLAVERRA
jgi:cytochrome P450